MHNRSKHYQWLLAISYAMGFHQREYPKKLILKTLILATMANVNETLLISSISNPLIGDFWYNRALPLGKDICGALLTSE